MKKMLLCLIGMLFLSMPVYAKVGDVAGDIYSTDIRTQVDGRDIQGYAIDGMTLIALEDLADYGFTIYYNDNIRTLFVTKTGTAADDFNPEIKRGVPGKIIGHYYETDIDVFINGEKMYAFTYALDGKTAVPVEKLVELKGKLNIYSYMDNGEMGNPHNVFGDMCYMKYSYDDNKRLLSLTTEPDEGISYESVSKALLGETTPWEAARGYLLHSNDYLYFSETLGGIMRGPAKDRNVVMYNGITYNALGLIRQYGLHSHTDKYTEIYEPVFSDDGKNMYFIHKFDGGYDYKQLEMQSMHIKPLDEAEYIKASTRLDKSDYSFTINNRQMPLYKIGGRDYICADDFAYLGYKLEYNNQLQLFELIETESDTDDFAFSDLEPGYVKKIDADMKFFESDYYITKQGLVQYGEQYLIPVDAFIYDYYYSNDIKGIKYYYDISEKKIIAREDI